MTRPCRSRSRGRASQASAVAAAAAAASLSPPSPIRPSTTTPLSPSSSSPQRRRFLRFPLPALSTFHPTPFALGVLLASLPHLPALRRRILPARRGAVTSASISSRASASSLETHHSGSEEASSDDAAAAPEMEAAASAALDCPVCLGEPLLPRVAPCGHTLCTPCLMSLSSHSRRPVCPVCRMRLKTPVERLPINFALKTLVEAKVAARGERAWEEFVAAEEEARAELAPCGGGSGGREAGAGGSGGRTGIVDRVRPAWNWFKWTVIIVTELGAFLVSLKEVLEAAPARTRRYQRIV